MYCQNYLNHLTKKSKFAVRHFDARINKEKRAQAAAAIERLKKETKLCEDMVKVMDLKLNLLVSDKESAFLARGVLHNEQGKKYREEHNEYAI